MYPEYIVDCALLGYLHSGTYDGCGKGVGVGVGVIVGAGVGVAVAVAVGSDLALDAV